MSNNPESKEAQVGPFDQTYTKTIEIAGPIKFTITEKTTSTHVPPEGKPCGCHDKDDEDDGPSNSDIMSTINQLAAVIAQYVQAKAAQ